MSSKSGHNELAQIAMNPIAGPDAGQNETIDAPGEAIAGLSPGTTHAKGRVSLHTGLCIGVVIVAAGALFGMRHIGLGPGTSAAASVNVKMEVPKPRTNTTLQQAVLADLNASRAAMQVPGDKVRVNPFMLALAIPPRAKTVQLGETTDPTTLSENEQQRLLDDQRKQLREVRAKVETAAAQLRFNAAMGSGPNAMARINDRLYRAGERVGEYFVVKSIQPHQVELFWEGQTFVISLPESGRK
jgi:hypothetical protein